VNFREESPDSEKEKYRKECFERHLAAEICVFCVLTI